MNQEDFFSQLIRGEIPVRWAEQYEHFREHVMGDHLILLAFGCGCYRFLEVNAKWMGPILGSGGVIVPGRRVEYTFAYLYPHGNVDCGAKLVSPEWLQRNLKVFPIELGYRHNYADYVFREHDRALKEEAARANFQDRQGPTLLPGQDS